MSIDDRLSEKWLPSWIRGEGQESDIVLSSRIRLARNFSDLPFPHVASDAVLKEVTERTRSAVAEINEEIGYPELEFKDLNRLNSLDRLVLVEKHLLSPQHLENIQNRAIVLNKTETISIMVNEEDHLRIQSFCPGLELEQAWQGANSLDDLLERRLKFSFHEERGFLTSCPTNAGTGMRASVMVHLPALVLTKQVGRVFNNVAKFGLTVRGLYGEGTEAFGNLFQISNQITLGQKEEEIIDNLYRITKQVIEQERMVRQGILVHGREEILNRVGRAYGTLKYAHIISTQEAMTLLSDLRLGVDLDLNREVSRRTLNELIILIGPAFLQKIVERELGPEERDVQRAVLIRKKLDDSLNKTGGE
jgi:protein arginine kinase